MINKFGPDCLLIPPCKNVANDFVLLKLEVYLDIVINLLSS